MRLSSRHCALAGLIAATAFAACASPAAPPRTRQAAALGVVDLAGGTSKVTFSAGAVAPPGGYGLLAGIVRNETGATIDGVTITLAPNPTTSNAPWIAGGRVGDSTIPAGGLSMDVPLVPSLDVGRALPITIELGEAREPLCDLLDVWITPLVKPASPTASRR